MDYILGVFYAVLAFYAGGASSYDVESANRLLKNLTSGYERMLRPNDRVTVSIALSASTINTLDLKQQQFSITGHFIMVWTDTRLSWSRTDFGDISTIFFTEEYIWKPELVIENAAKTVPIIHNDQLALKVSAKGEVLWDPPGIYLVTCDIDVTYYPFDTQTCHLTISSWAYGADEIKVVPLDSNVRWQNFQENGEWDLKNSYITEKTGINRPKLKFFFVLKRKTGYYVINMVIPPMLTSFLGLIVFLLPADSGEKVGFSVTILLALAVLLTITTEYIPSTSNDTSIYGVYLVCNLFISALEVIITNVVLQLHHRTDEKVPHRLQQFARLVLTRTSCNKGCRRKTKVKDTSEVSPLPRGPQVSPYLSQVKLNGSVNATSMIEGSDVTDVEELDDETGYTWTEIAAMVDRTAFYVITLMWAVISVVFTVVLVYHW